MRGDYLDARRDSALDAFEHIAKNIHSALSSETLIGTDFNVVLVDPKKPCPNWTKIANIH